MGSKRLPGKVLRPILGRPMLARVVERARLGPSVTQVVVATSDSPSDEPIRQFCAQESVAVFSGSEEDVLDRFYQAACLFGGDPLLRITADCPLLSPAIIEQLIQMYRTGTHDYVAVATGAGAAPGQIKGFPDGMDTECFSFAVLKRAWREATDPRDREHVTRYLWHNPRLFRTGMLTGDRDYRNLRFTVDHEVDFHLVQKIYEALYREDRPFQLRDILEFLESHPEICDLNQHLSRAQGYLELHED